MLDSSTASPKPSTALWLEFAAIYAAAPLLILAVRQRLVMLVVLWLGALGAYRFLTRRRMLPYAGEWNWAGLRAGAPGVVLRFAILAGLVTLAEWRFAPQAFLSFPRQRPEFWLLVMVLYPVLSVWPQELIYRSFLLHRYRPLFGGAWRYILTSALVFGFAHVMFLNWIAPAMTVIGGALFATSYRRHRSLALSCLEHALYGDMIFTVGLGSYFFTGAAWRH
jgi:uncharacterized protein